MRIKPITLQNIPKFKSINLVQIPKKAFSNPEDKLECRDEFDSIFKYYISDTKEPTLFERVKKFLKTDKPKASYVMEKPSYYAASIAMKQNNLRYSLSWLRRNSGLPISEPIDENYYSFFVYTKDDALRAQKMVKKNLGNFGQYKVEGLERYGDRKDIANVYAEAKVGVDIERDNDELIKSIGIRKFRVKSFAGLGDIIKDLNI